MRRQQEPVLRTVEVLPEGAELGSLVVVSYVRATNVLRDIREMWTNITGGDMRRYSVLLAEALAEGRRQFAEALRQEGYDGAVGVRIVHPSVTERGAEIVIYGTGYRLRTD